jgi:uncharacterized protein YeaO (DUF488 family)
MEANVIRIKRVYDPPGPQDGERILIDRLWPRGVSKEKACVDEWRKDLAPSDQLRKWFNHEPEKWDEFRRRYQEELRPKLTELEELFGKHPGPITLLYGAHDTEHNNGVLLKEILDGLQITRKAAGDKKTRKTLQANARKRPRPRAAEKRSPR